MARFAMALVCLTFAASTASAKPAIYSLPDRHALYVYECSEPAQTVRQSRRAKHAKSHSRHSNRRGARQRAVSPLVAAPAQTAPSQIAPLVEKARALLGQTAAQLGLPRSLWCADFIAKIAPDAARKVDNPRWARDYAELPKTEPKPGAIVVLTRGRGGHIGVLDRFDRNGNPIIISGNHGHKVGIGTYPKGRVLAYVSGG